MEEILPKDWEKLLADHWQTIQKNNVDLYEVQKLKKPARALSLVFKVPSPVNKKILQRLQQIITFPLTSFITFQPYQGYHFTIQWAPENEAEKLDLVSFISELKQALKNFNRIKGKILFPFFGRAGLMGMFKTENDDEFLKIREKIEPVWQQAGLTLKFGQEFYPLAYLSLTRYPTLMTSEAKPGFKNLPTQKVEDVSLNSVLLVLNDKFLTPRSTRVLAKIPLFDN